MALRRSEGIPRPPSDRKKITISDELLELLESERKFGEFGYSTTIERLFYERAQTIKTLRQENEDLQAIVKKLWLDCLEDKSSVFLIVSFQSGNEKGWPDTTRHGLGK
jgi:hypothetical protein